MQSTHTQRAVSASFDDPNLVSAAGLVPVMMLARKTGLAQLAGVRLTVPEHYGANAGLKVTALVAGMVAGQTPLVNGIDELALVDIDDTIKEVHGYQKQDSGYGYSGVRGLNALIGTVTSGEAAPVILGSRLRKGACGSPRGAGKFVADILATVGHLRSPDATVSVLLRADSAFYSHAVVSAAARAGADVSITARMDPSVKRAIATIDETAWTKIEYTDAIRDEQTGQLISSAEVAEVPFTAFSSKKKADQVTGRLVVRRIPELNKKAGEGQGTLFDTHPFHGNIPINGS